jgi:geranylgeranyl pyrophosphate synthase
MAGGQALDLAAEGRTLALPEVERIHALKTGALIRASVMMAAHCADGLDAERLAALASFGGAVGLAFQVQDDILDVEGDAALTGRPPGSDVARGMPTYPAVAGLEAARARVAGLHAEAAGLLNRYGWSGGALAALAEWLLARRR